MLEDRVSIVVVDINKWDLNIARKGVVSEQCYKGGAL